MTAMAGIRLEHGNLVVRQSWFRDSEEGILSADDPDSSVLIEHSTFSRLGRCDRACPVPMRSISATMPA
jgi:hypothetical protein